MNIWETPEYAAGYRAADTDTCAEPIAPAGYTPAQAAAYCAGWNRALDDTAHAYASEADLC